MTQDAEWARQRTQAPDLGGLLEDIYCALQFEPQAPGARPDGIQRMARGYQHAAIVDREEFHGARYSVVTVKARRASVELAEERMCAVLDKYETTLVAE